MSTPTTPFATEAVPSASPTAAPRRRRVPRWSVGTWIAVGFGVLILGAAIFAGRVVPYDPTDIVGMPSQPPSGEHWGGTDSTGMDVFSRTVAAARIDVLIALCATVLATGAGVLVGMLIGMNEAGRGPLGLSARGISRGLDLLEAVPTIIISLVVVAFFGMSNVTMVIALAVILTPIQARLTRTEVLRVRTEAYLDAARQTGLGEVAVTLRHALPNSIRPALENSSVVFGITIVLTAALGFLGVGLPPPTPEWGSMITRGAGDAAVGRWWSAGFPAVALCVTVGTVSVLARRFILDRSR